MDERNYQTVDFTKFEQLCELEISSNSNMNISEDEQKGFVKGLQFALNLFKNLHDEYLNICQEKASVYEELYNQEKKDLDILATGLNKYSKQTDN